MTVRGWLKRSRWSLVGLAVAIPVAVVGTFSVGWFQYIAATTPHPRMVATGDSVVDKKVSWKLDSHEVVQADSDQGRDLGALEGTEVVIVTMKIDSSKLGKKDPVLCNFELVAPGPGALRHWEDSQTEVRLPYGGDGYTTGCILSDRTAFTLKLVFVLPTGTADQVSLQLTDGYGEPPVLQWDW